jgi:hypothetical protein
LIFYRFNRLCFLSMRGGLITGLAVFASLWMISGSVSFGDFVTIDRVNQQQNGGSIYGANPSYMDTTSGGEFTLIPSDAVLLSFYSPAAIVEDPNLNNQKGFQSFCLELNTGFPTSLPVGPLSYEITPTILNDPSETVTLGTAWLYSQFANGTLKGYDYTDVAATFSPIGLSSARAADAAALQAAIWFLEGQYPGSQSDGYLYAGGAGNKFLTLLTAPAADGGLGLADLTDAFAADPGAYSVDVMNVGDPGLYQYQAQLVIDPLVSPLVPVPEASTVLFPVGLALYAGFRLLRRARIATPDPLA